MNLQTNKQDRGFTIVELLIVIVVIGILAAITIVAFNGVQQRANNSAAQSAANQVLKKAEAYNSVKGAYPTTTAQFNATDVKESNLEGVAIVGTLSATNGKTTVNYQTCGTGFRVVSWDYSTGAATTAANSLHGGGATSASTCTTVAS